MSIPKLGREQIKTYFETGDRPTEDEFVDFIESGINQKDDEVCVDSSDPSDIKIGIGTNQPEQKLHVEGNVFISNVNGAVSKGQNALEVNAPNTHGIAVRTSQNDVMNFYDDNGTLNSSPFTFSDQTGRGFRFYQHNSNAPGISQEKFGIYRNGNVGVNMIEGQMATAKFEVRGVSEDESREGILRIEGPQRQAKENLRFGIVEGERSWIQSHLGPLYINKIGRDTILNANASNVGIGTENPSKKLEVYGDVRFKTNLGQVDISNKDHKGSRSSNIQHRRIDGAQGGNIRYRQVWENLDGSTVFKGGYIDTYKDGNKRWVQMGSIDTSLYFGAKTDLYITGGDSVSFATKQGEAGRITENKNWFFEGEATFEKSINVKENIKIKDEFPFLLKRFAVEISSTSGYNTGKSFTEFEGASIAGFATSTMYQLTHWPEDRKTGPEHSHKVSTHIYVFMRKYAPTGNWHIFVDLHSDKKHELWNVDVLFMRKGIVELETSNNIGASWYSSLIPPTA